MATAIRSTMTYPPAPWSLQGRALLAFHVINADAARNFVPSGLEIVSFLPGKTLGGIYLSAYGAGSILHYNELIVVPALVRYKNTVAFWISHIYVDNPDSVAGGREIWKLPKELAEFHWGESSIRVCQNGDDLCSLAYLTSGITMPGWWQPTLTGKVLSSMDSVLLLFENTFQGQFTLGRSALTVPATSPLASLSLGQPLLVLETPSLQLTAGIPQRITRDGITHV